MAVLEISQVGLRQDRCVHILYPAPSTPDIDEVDVISKWGTFDWSNDHFWLFFTDVCPVRITTTATHGPGVCLGDGQMEDEGVQSKGGRGDALLLTWPDLTWPGYTRINERIYTVVNRLHSRPVATGGMWQDMRHDTLRLGENLSESHGRRPVAT